MSTQKTYSELSISTPEYDCSKLTELIKGQSCHHRETSQWICSGNQLTGFYMMTTLAFNELIKYRNALRPWTIKTIEQCSNLFKVSNSNNIGMGETCSASALQTPVGTRCRFSVYETSIWRQGHLMDVIWTSHGRLMYVETTSCVYRDSRTTCGICSISVIKPIKDTKTM